MCEHDKVTNVRPGSCLRDGELHEDDHADWSRRTFLSTVGSATTGVVMVGSTPVRALGHSPLLSALRALETDRILVLIQLSGGNDGLNTIVPVEDANYYNARGGLAISKNSTIAISNELGLHPSLADLEVPYFDGDMAILQNVGYPAPNLSHFRSTDIWLTASDSSVVEQTGWAGRYLDDRFPDFDNNPPANPLAVQIGGFSSTMFQGPNANMGMSIANLDLFTRLAQTGELYDTSTIPPTSYGAEMQFVRSVANDAFNYAGAVQTAASNGSNSVTYPAPNPLADSLAIVAQLIKGNLGAHIYTVTLGGFDTHANQLGAHATLLRYIAEAVTTFQADLAADGLDDRVLTTTFSEFGRRVNANFSFGTDHGTAAPLLVFGSGVNGGIFADAPDLVDLDNGGNLKFQIDFRSVYYTLLQDWFGLPAIDVEAILGGQFENIGFVADPTSVGTTPSPQALPELFSLEQNYPNPFNPTTTIRFDLSASAHVRLDVFDTQGRHVETLADRGYSPGSHDIAFDGANLTSGMYLYRLEAGGRSETRKMLLIR